MNVLGISCYFHDSAAALISDGNIIAAAQEERFTRRKHDASFPVNAAEYCLQEAEISLKDIDSIVFYEKPRLRWKRVVDTYTSIAPHGKRQFWEAIQKWYGTRHPERALRENLEVLLTRVGGDAYSHSIQYVDHHLSHASSAFYPSPFEKAAILTIDGVGEYATTTYSKEMSIEYANHSVV